jgi:hypothetical protein
MDSIRVSEAPDPGSIPGEATALTEAIAKVGFNIFHVLFPTYIDPVTRFVEIISGYHTLG